MTDIKMRTDDPATIEYIRGLLPINRYVGPCLPEHAYKPDPIGDAYVATTKPKAAPRRPSGPGLPGRPRKIYPVTMDVPVCRTKM